MENQLRAFIKLGRLINGYLKSEQNGKRQQLDELIDRCYQHNGWFNRPNVIKALEGIAYMLREEDLRAFAAQLQPLKNQKTVAVIMAGNLPAVGFHDMLCVLLSGHRILIKLSSDDSLLIPYFTQQLINFEPAIKDLVRFSEGKLEKFDAVIATGTNNSARYFEHYFGKYPHIIRKNRTSVAVLSGQESAEELLALGHDVFDYFGLGCRNVSKLFVPRGYKPATFFEGIFSFSYVIENKKYANNYEYNRAVYLLNREPFLDNNFLILKESREMHSPVGVLFYEEYASLETVRARLKELEPELQCIVTNTALSVTKEPFGAAQKPGVFTFADNVNTIAFLNNLT